MFSEIILRVGYLILRESGYFQQILIHPSADRHQEFPEKTGQHLLILPGTFHKFIPHLFEEILILVRDSGVKNISVQRNVVMPQNVFTWLPVKCTNQYWDVSFPRK